MKVLSFIDSTPMAIYPPKLDELRQTAIANSAQITDVVSFVEKNKSLPSDSSPIAPSSIATRAGSRLSGTAYAEDRNGVAVINISGALFTSGGLIDDFYAWLFGGTSTRQLAKDIQSAADNQDVKAIVLNINSGGGEAFGINELSNLIYSIRGKKPIKAYIAGYGASAAYFIAAGCDEIICDAQAFIGSIGVVAGWADYKDFYKMMGIIYEEVTSSNAPYKRLDPRNEEHRAIFQSELDGMEKVFIAFVAKGRDVSVEKVKSDFGQGAVMAGWQAVKAGMADRVGSLEQVIKQLQSNRKSDQSNARMGAEKTGEKNMSLSDKLKAFFASDEVTPLLESGKEYAIVESAVSQTPTASADLTAANNRAAAAEKELADFKAEQRKNAEAQVKTDAETFVTAEIQAGRMLPAEKETFQLLYVQAAADDQAHPLAEGSRLGNLKTIQSKRKSHGYNVEQLDPKGVQIIHGADSDEAKMEREVEAQANSYVGTVSPKTNVSAVK